MVTFVKGDIFKSPAQVLTNTVNCVGVMGKGVALEFKNRYPQMFYDYKSKCDQGNVKPGQPHLGALPDLDVYVYEPQGAAAIRSDAEGRESDTQNGDEKISARPREL